MWVLAVMVVMMVLMMMLSEQRHRIAPCLGRHDAQSRAGYELHGTLQMCLLRGISIHAVWAV